MAEAVALGASVVAFIGIAGQIVQGCISISAFIGDVKDTPSYLKNLRKEVKMMQSILEGFSRHLKDLEDTGIPLCDEQLTKEALALSKEAVDDLSQMTSKYTQNIVTWSKFRFAMKKNSWQKSLAKIECAKNSLLTAQAFIILYAEYPDTLSLTLR
ncbi:hypothetical protein B0O99DRAFT_503967 [Bisporella sp. PMI_857]|nr:hypothetical protein B0O99DRAFT_503967 [Bisporella sp. PMI_857]